jgi:hypothetical protein
VSNELGSGIGGVNGDQTTNVIDVDAKRTGTDKNYSTPTLYIAELATWEIPKTTIPIDPKAVSDWENKGQGIPTLPTSPYSLIELAQRAAQLMEAHIEHRRWFTVLGITYVLERDQICFSASGIESTITKLTSKTETRRSQTN